MIRTIATPQELYGPLLAAVQERDILNDGKTFVDAEPKRPVAEIMADFARVPHDDEALAHFVAQNFDLPPAADDVIPAGAEVGLREYIRRLWHALARGPDNGAEHSSALPVHHRYVVPGGRFREIYYWDSFFTMLGLLRDGETELATGIVDAMTDLIEHYGHVPNGARTYYLGRSQPPLYYMMVGLIDGGQPTPRRLAAMKREHAWWMSGAEDLAPGERNGRVARLADGSLVNRYWDLRNSPRDESWREDVATAKVSGRPSAAVYRDLRAGAESGWDFSSRWLESSDLSSIRTTSIAPVDLNAFLYGLERAIAEGGSVDDARTYSLLMDQRREAVQKHFWDDRDGYFADLDLETGQRRDRASAATLAPLMVGMATAPQADAVAALVNAKFLAPGGLRTTLCTSGEQWDMPNGWAPLQWIAVSGLRRYGHDDLAREVARSWIATVEATYRRTGLVHEKYDIEAATIGIGGEYEPQTGFGWTNGVTADFLDWLAKSHDEALGSLSLL